MSHRVIYIEKSECLRLYLDNLKVIISDDELLIPVSDIQILVIDNYKATLSIQLMNKLTENNVCVIFCGMDHLPQSSLLPMNGNFAQSGNINKQIAWKDENKLLAHQLIIRAKIYNQIEILRKLNKGYNTVIKLEQFLNEIQLGDETNREGLAAKMYFRELFGSDFVRMNEDIINAGLNYGYSIIRSLISSIICAKGYLGNFGIFHRGKQNMFNLADDIIEVFRPIIDEYVYLNMRDEIIFKQKHREGLIRICSDKKIEICNQQQTIANAIYVYIEALLKVLETGNPKAFIFPLPYLYDI